MTKLSNLLSTRASFDNPEVILPKPLNEGFKTASQVQYVATAGNYKEKGLEFRGDLYVLQSIFSYDYLWLNVRVKGGAYGCMCAFARSVNAYFTSYRDPNLMETYNIYKEAPAYVRGFDADERDMIKYIIGAISKLDSPLTPSAERNQVLAATVDSIRELAPYVEAAVGQDVICVIGNENKLESAKDNFKTVASVF